MTIEFLSNPYILWITAALSAFVLSTRFYLYPIIIGVSKVKGLMDSPDGRKMHASQTPTLGGLGVFIAFSLTIIAFGLVSDLTVVDLSKLLALLGAAIILVFLGIKDDLTSMAPKKKFLGQLLAVLTVVLFSDIRINAFDGLLGLQELPYLVSVFFSVFVFILVINALNLIDGIDGLAGFISVLASGSFGVLFLVNGDYLMTLVSAILIGSVVGFLRYNLSNDKKIFMGDCGSMLTGFLLAYQGVCFLNLNAGMPQSEMMAGAPVILLAILSYPLFDLLRVFAIRIRQGKSPFAADANHIHHRLLRIGFAHKKATLVLGLANSLVIIVAFLGSGLEIHLQLIFTVLFGIAVYLVPFLGFFDMPSGDAMPTSDVRPQADTQSAVVPVHVPVSKRKLSPQFPLAGFLNDLEEDGLAAEAGNIHPLDEVPKTELVVKRVKNLKASKDKLKKPLEYPGPTEPK